MHLHQVLKDQQDRPYTANKQGEPVTARVVTTSHPLSPPKKYKKKQPLDIQGVVFWIPKIVPIQTPNL